MRISYSYKKGAGGFKRKALPMKVTRPSPRRKKSRGKTALLALALLGAVGTLILIGALGWLTAGLPDPNKLMDRVVSQSTKIYDRTGQHLLYEVHGEEQRSLVALADVPSALKWATIVAEDRDFYSHKGFDLRGIARAIVVDVLTGRKAQGGSTITQQFIKNALLSSKKTFTRKFRELILAYQIEKRFTKDQILQLYLNEIPYGSTAYGVSAAAQLYFAKNITELTTAESALLASLPRAPSYYSPWGANRDKLIARQHRILDGMATLDIISRDEAEDAKNQKLTFREERGVFLAPHFVNYVREQLSATYGEKLVQEGGLKITTALDFEKQLAAEKAITQGSKTAASFGASNAALVSLSAHTGEILAMVGSKDYFDESIDGNVNVVLRKRQPGSSFKPIVYATAFSRGFTPSTIIFDLVTNFSTDPSQKDYTPHNYTDTEYGPVTMKKALAGSLNIAAVKTLYLAGVRNVITLAKTLGYQSLQDPDRYGLALVLGGAEVTLLEHTAAFTVFAREGSVVTPVSILKVQDSRGTTLEEWRTPAVTDTLDPEAARQINDILSDNSARTYIFGAKNHLTLPGRSVAAKTGTTNDYRDAWTIGYTPSLVTGVWVGNNDNTAMKRGADGSKIAAPIWNQYMRASLAGMPVEPFQKPLPLTTGVAVLDGEYANEKKVMIDSTTGEPATDLTPPELRQERITREIHTILHLLDKNNPRAVTTPDHPEQDPQYSVWEKGVRAWVKKNNIEEGVLTPTTTPSSDSQAPTLVILTPQENETIASDTLTATLQVSAPSGVGKVEYFLDDALIASPPTAPYNLSYPLELKDNGFRSLKVRVTDLTGNTQQGSVVVNLLVIKK